MASSSRDVLIVGGGAIGLSIAWELVQRGAHVTVVDRGEFARESSWAGAGMIPPGPDRAHWARATTLERMAGLSSELHPQWRERLLDETGIDNEYRRCGTIRLAGTPEEIELVFGLVRRWQDIGIECQNLSSAQIAELEPQLVTPPGDYSAAYFVPAEAQIRNPRHLRGLMSACRTAGVELLPRTAIHGLKTDQGRISAVVSDGRAIPADQFCITAGCWTGELTQKFGVHLPVKPIRGQIILLRGDSALINRNVYVGLRYLTPRLDGRILVGSTMEDVGFIKENTEEATTALLTFATGLCPALARLPEESRWSGLRPGTADGKPYLGRLPHWENAWVASGHFRAGLQLAPATAVIMASLILGEQPVIDVSELGVDR